MHSSLKIREEGGRSEKIREEGEMAEKIREVGENLGKKKREMGNLTACSSPLCRCKGNAV